MLGSCQCKLHHPLLSCFRRCQNLSLAQNAGILRSKSRHPLRSCTKLMARLSSVACCMCMVINPEIWGSGTIFASHRRVIPYIKPEEFIIFRVSFFLVREHWRRKLNSHFKYWRSSSLKRIHFGKMPEPGTTQTQFSVVFSPIVKHGVR